MCVRMLIDASTHTHARTHARTLTHTHTIAPSQVLLSAFQIE